MHPPILSSPIPKEKLYMYLAVSEWAISAALFRCPSPKEQKPVYYVSRALADVETRYSKMELTALALRSAAQKLRPYFQAHPVIVLTDQPLRSILHKPDLTGRMLQWAIELSEFGIEFQPRLSKKGQVMADFVLEYSRRPNQHHESSEQEWWTLRVDGASRSSGSGVGLVLQSPTGEHLEQAIRLGFSASNNEQNTRPSCCPFHPDGGTCTSDPFTGPYLRCLGHSEAQYVLAELHEGICGNHTGGRSLAHRAHSQGYYWPTMKKDAAAYVQKCDKCQRYAPIPHMPSAALKSVSGPWPFAQWGMDIVGPLPAAPAQKKFLLVATDYFSKWVEAEAYASIKDKDVTKFHCIQEFLFGIEYPEFILHATLSSKQWPGGSHKQNSNQCLKEKAGASQREVGGGATRRPMGLSNHTRTTNRKYSFALTYGMDAVIPTEIGLPTIRTDAAKQKDANTELGRNLDWADEVRESASIRMADYQQRASAHYNRKVRPRNFKNGTLVLRKVFENTAEVGAGKFQANWEGPYIVSKANENGAYHLQKLDGTPLLRPWNVFNLKQYYQ
ncbi:hypothetical protein CK203_107515 [Vitis vinifera]|uniref:Gypsy retrotransposon integrase-like protein 1 n=1 Tax=Vitis vinifera TaxID=29760 RepID=A0A438CSJ5_VITVI|nr:hypothetical protein CK203_107515 [Vitis vinifera]